ncbi:hypothetical protein BC829DRAFT_489161 [Chytridium lagenaria]|nr:hypothetical protein BC829DRAFT_489161 [Chytridium lagenaria]
MSTYSPRRLKSEWKRSTYTHDLPWHSHHCTPTIGSPAVHIPGLSTLPPGLSTPLLYDMAYRKMTNPEHDLPRRVEDGSIPTGMVKAEEMRMHGSDKEKAGDGGEGAGGFEGGGMSKGGDRGGNGGKMEDKHGMDSKRIDDRTGSGGKTEDRHGIDTRNRVDDRRGSGGTAEGRHGQIDGRKGSGGRTEERYGVDAKRDDNRRGSGGDTKHVDGRKGSSGKLDRQDGSGKPDDRHTASTAPKSAEGPKDSTGGKHYSTDKPSLTMNIGVKGHPESSAAKSPSAGFGLGDGGKLDTGFSFGGGAPKADTGFSFGAKPSYTPAAYEATPKRLDTSYNESLERGVQSLRRISGKRGGGGQDDARAGKSSSRDQPDTRYPEDPRLGKSSPSRDQPDTRYSEDARSPKSPSRDHPDTRYTDDPTQPPSPPVTALNLRVPPNLQRLTSMRHKGCLLLLGIPLEKNSSEQENRYGGERREQESRHGNENEQESRFAAGKKASNGHKDNRYASNGSIKGNHQDSRYAVGPGKNVSRATHSDSTSGKSHPDKRHSTASSGSPQSRETPDTRYAGPTSTEKSTRPVSTAPPHSRNFDTRSRGSNSNLRASSATVSRSLGDRNKDNHVPTSPAKRKTDTGTSPRPASASSTRPKEPEHATRSINQPSRSKPAPHHLHPSTYPSTSTENLTPSSSSASIPQKSSQRKPTKTDQKPQHRDIRGVTHIFRPTTPPTAAPQSSSYTADLERRKNAVISRGLKEIEMARRRGDTQWDHDKGGLGARSPLITNGSAPPGSVRAGAPYATGYNGKVEELAREARIAGIGFGRRVGVGPEIESSKGWGEGEGRPRTGTLRFSRD